MFVAERSKEKADVESIRTAQQESEARRQDELIDKIERAKKEQEDKTQEKEEKELKETVKMEKERMVEDSKEGVLDELVGDVTAKLYTMIDGLHSIPLVGKYNI